jgi:type VI protein secretion system component VasF
VSAAYWLICGVVTAVNVALFVGAQMNLNSASDALDEALEALDEALEAEDLARRLFGDITPT